MKITYLAKTEPKMSYENERVMWYKEYALAQFDDEKERCNFAGKYHISEVLNFLNPVVSMRRRLDALESDLRLYVRMQKEKKWAIERK